MLRKEFGGLSLPRLGVGCMRLPVLDNDDSKIDEEKTEDLLSYAMKNSANYFDTAWGYHGGNSEKSVGRLLTIYNRSDYFLTSKFPGYDLSNMDKVEEIFEKQLAKCRTDYFDCYLIHNVCEMNIDAYLDPKYGIIDYLMKQKEKGRIIHLGFSAHGSTEVMTRFIDAYGEYMEFCQIQLNYLDWILQDAKSKVDLLNERGLPIWVMEPLRGGRLAKLPDEAEARLKKLRPDESIPGWAFRFLQSIPGVQIVLSGMSNMEQLRENIEIFETEKPLSETEMNELLDIAKGMLDDNLPCTSCRYCTSHCPQGLDIPELIKLYNEHSFSGGGFLAPMALMAMPEDKQPSACVGCKSCEAVCPQQIKISEAMKDFSEKVKDFSL